MWRPFRPFLLEHPPTDTAVHDESLFAARRAADGAARATRGRSPPPTRVDQGDGVPNGYTIIAFKQPEAENRRFVRSAEGIPQQLVNVCDGGERSEVAYRIDDGPYVEMGRTSRADPFIVQHYARHPETLEQRLKVKESSHIWTASLPADLAPGVYRVSVRTTGRFGQVFEASEVFEVAGVRR